MSLPRPSSLAAPGALEVAAGGALPTDAELMARVREGDREAFGELVERHKDALVAYLVRLAGERERAEDLAQEAFLRLFHAARTYRERGQLKAFLYRIATNLLRSEERRRRRWRLLSAAWVAEGAAPLSGGGSDGPGSEARLLEAELKEHVAEAVAQLPLLYRVPLVLYEIEGWPQGEIARLLECREGTVKSRLSRARERLRRRLAPYWTNGDTP